MDFGAAVWQLGLPLPPVSGTDERCDGRVPAVTSDTEARTEEAIDTAASVAELTVETPNSTALAARFLKAAVGFLGIGVALLMILAIKRVVPEFLGGSAFLSYGRVLPAATTLLLYGWLTLALLGALLYIVPRVAKADLADLVVLQAALAVLVVAVLGGAIAVLMGFSEGRRYLEPPLAIDLVTLVGLVVVGRSITLVARRATDPSPEIWYSVAAVIWLVMTHVVGNFPGLQGFTGQLQSSFYRSSLIGLWIASATVAVVYHVVPKLGGRPPLRATKLSVLGIWSLGFVWAMTAPAELTFGAAGDWLETIGVIFSIVLFLPIVVIATDLTHAMRGAWSNVRDRTSLRLVMAGLVMLAVFALFNLVQALRASSAVIGFTDWVAAIETLVLLGPFTFVLFAFLRVAAPDVFGRDPSPSMLGYREALVGLGLTVGAMAVAGVQTGFTWAGSANSQAFSNTGDGWISTLAPLAGNYVAQLVGLAIFAVGAALIVRAAMGGGDESLLATPMPPAEAEADLVLDRDVPLKKVRRYGYGFFALAALMVLVLPALEREDPTLLADRDRTYESGSSRATGRAIYIQEGCAYCHTQQVRPIVPDVGLGPVSVLGDYANETPALIGVQRYGPDLMHLGDRADAEAVAEHLRSPQASRSWSIMPSYDYLTLDDLAALAQYLAPPEE